MSTSTLRKPPQAADFPPEQVTPATVFMLELYQRLYEENQALRDDNARLKGGNPKPRIKPSKLDSGGPDNDNDNDNDKAKGKGRGKHKRSKTPDLEIHEQIVCKPEAPLPEGSRFKGYEDFTVQGIRIELHNIRYRIERWVTPDDQTLRGQLPPELGGYHFDPELRTFILHQYHHAHVTQPLLLEQLREWGVEISAGQLSRLLTEGHEAFHAEADAVLRAGLAYSDYVHVDDTGARHQGRNGFCTHIGNELFAFFASTESKSRINFLELLRAGDERTIIDAEALAYMAAQGLPQAPLAQLTALEQRVFEDQAAWQAALERLGIDDKRHIRIATEGALLGAVLTTDINPELVIVSDDAGQFNILIHALCWIHAERGIHKLLGFNDAQRAALEWARGELWAIYWALKAYKAEPSAEARAAQRTEIEARFEALCTTKTCFESLNQALKRLHRNGAELLRVLDHPYIPLHNNLSENDVREQVKACPERCRRTCPERCRRKRKISGATRGETGRRCRDTFASNKKTCRKNGIPFWAFLHDRVTGTYTIPWLPRLIFGVDGEWPAGFDAHDGVATPSDRTQPAGGR